VYSVVPSPTGQRAKKAMTDLEYDVSLVPEVGSAIFLGGALSLECNLIFYVR